MPKRRRGQRSLSDRRRGRDAVDAASPEFYEYEPGVEVPRDVTHLRVPPSIRILPDGVFHDLEHLVEVELSEGLLEIEYGAFSGCTSLVRVRLPSTLVRIGSLAFNQCSSLRRVRIPSTVATIGEHAFLSCSALREVILVDGIQEIKDFGFADCQSLVSLVLPVSVIHVGNDAFRGCTALRTVMWCGGIIEIGWKGEVARSGRNAFHECDLLDHVRTTSAVLVITNTGLNHYTESYTYSFHLARDGTVPRTERPQKVIASECFNSMSPEDMTELERRIREVLMTEDDGEESGSESGEDVAPSLTWDEQRGQLRDLLAPHEARHKEEVTTLLELALWKARLAGSDGAIPEIGAPRRQESRVRSGAGEVIPHVLPFL